jgi:DNA-directed RNA polymerase specialized sigma24 family protein
VGVAAGLLSEDELATQDDVPDRQSAWAEEYLEAEELLFRIHRLLGELPKAQRQAFMLHVLESYDLTEIASLQRRSEGEVRTDIEGARDMFVERLRAGAKPHPSADCAVGVGVLATGTPDEA